MYIINSVDLLGIDFQILITVIVFTASHELCGLHIEGGHIFCYNVLFCSVFFTDPLRYQ